MTDKKLTDNEIIKTLECCISGDCDNCHYDEQTACNEYMKQDALDLINRLQAENEQKDKNYIELLKTSGERAVIIGEQGAEIERLKNENKHFVAEYKKANIALLDSVILKDKIKAEAYKEFAELVHCHCQSIINQEWNKKVAPVSWADAYEQFDDEAGNLLKELVGEDNG